MRPGRGCRRLAAPTGGVLCLALLLALAALAFAPVAGAAPGDIGFEGPSSMGAGSAPTGSKPESKLWWNDGFWWASMWHAGSADFHILKLDQATQAWTDTGVALDDRPGTRADVLWDAAAGKLYVASHVFSESPASGHPARLYRFSYNAATDTYTRDGGFPVSINDFGRRRSSSRRTRAGSCGPRGCRAARCGSTARSAARPVTTRAGGWRSPSQRRW